MESQDKVKALRDHILAECDERGLTIFEFSKLITQLEFVEQNLFSDDKIIPAEGIQVLQ